MATSGNGRVTASGYAACITYQAARETSRKEMNTTIRGHNLKVTLLTALLAVLLLVAVGFAVWSAPTTSDGGGNPAKHARSADGTRGSSLAQDPIHRHVKVVERLGGGSLR
jgi:hypothetical protein